MKEYTVNESIMNKMILFMIEHNKYKIVEELIHSGVSTNIKTGDVTLLEKSILFKDYETFKFLTINDFEENKLVLKDILMSKISSFLRLEDYKNDKVLLNKINEYRELFECILELSIVKKSEEFMDVYILIAVLLNKQDEVLSLYKTLNAENKRDFLTDNNIEIQIIFAMLNRNYILFDMLVNNIKETPKTLLSRNALSQYACMFNEEYFISKLLCFKKDFLVENNRAETALHVLTANQNIKLLSSFHSELIENKELTEKLTLYAIKENLDITLKYLLNFLTQRDLIDLETLLFKAVEDGRKTIVRTLVNIGMNLNFKNSEGKWLLWEAIDRNDLSIVKYLLESGIDFEVQDNENMNAFLYSCSKNLQSISELLIRSGANLKKRDKNGYNALIWAIRHRNRLFFNELINEGIDAEITDTMGWTPLLWAIRMKDHYMAEKLIKNTKNILKRDFLGWGPLEWAINENNNEIISLLFTHGVNPEEKDINGRSAIYSSILKGNIRALNSLINRGAVINTLDNKGISPLDLALYNNEEEIVRLLKMKGAVTNSSLNDLDFEDSINNILKKLK